MRYLPTATAAALFLGASSLALAASPSDELLQYEGQTFACTGVGQQTQLDPLWANFPLKMVFTTEEGDYLGDIDITLMDAAGRTVVEAHCLAPWLMANVAPGSYTARLLVNQQHEKTVSFEVDADRQTKVVVPFSAVSGT